jgi:hypothetical protein
MSALADMRAKVPISGKPEIGARGRQLLDQSANLDLILTPVPWTRIRVA